MLNALGKFFRESMVARFLIPAGLVLIIFSVFVFIGVDKTSRYPKIEAEVSSVELYEASHYDEVSDTWTEDTYKVNVKYTVDGTDYDSEYGIFSGNYNVGDKVTICYNPDNPNEIAQPNGILLPIIILALGVASIAGGVISIVVAVKKHKKLKEQEKEWTTDGE